MRYIIDENTRSTESSETRCWTSNQPPATFVRTALLQRNPGEEGFGFVLTNSKSSTSRRPGDHCIARVVPGSASDRSRLLHVGDRLISVNGVNVTNLPREEVVRLVKSSGSQLALSFLSHSARMLNALCARCIAKIRGFLDLEVAVMPSYEQMQFYSSQFFPNQQRQQHQHHHQKARAIFFQVTLFRSSRGFGFSIRGGHEFNQMPLAVLRVEFTVKSSNTSGSFKVKELNSTQSVEDARILIITPKDGEAGAICPDHFTTMDAIVACKQTNFGIGGRIVEVSTYQ
ncbi:unnamed protein product [Rodentolepis nana]|uniref:PDZ domain-containing protein n=1 Tax=Rodentolepis nana TaxID=102285 RepID=A0A0R3TF74_RODNA|nr:unnamed protein product [Rodentolepis nana]